MRTQTCIKCNTVYPQRHRRCSSCGSQSGEEEHTSSPINQQGCRKCNETKCIGKCFICRQLLCYKCIPVHSCVALLTDEHLKPHMYTCETCNQKYAEALRMKVCTECRKVLCMSCYNKHICKLLQSDIEGDYTLFDAYALERLAKILKTGEAKYGRGNWHKISKLDHISHAVRHLLRHCDGIKSDEDELGNAFCRLMFACSDKVEQ